MSLKYRSHIRWRDRITWRGVFLFGTLAVDARYVVRARRRTYQVVRA